MNNNNSATPTLAAMGACFSDAPLSTDVIRANIDHLMGEFMRERDVAMLKEVIGGDGERVERLRQEMGSSPVTGFASDLASHYRRGVRLCMRYAYWRTMTVPEAAVFQDASECVWTASGHEALQSDMLVMCTSQDIPIVSLPSREEDERAVRKTLHFR
jgi:hypothetical protein